MKKIQFILLSISFAFFSCNSKSQIETLHPNIVVIYVDDLGYGDIGCYGATAIQTPNIDKMAQNGVLFTDGHSPASTCTPSRYALLTGQFAFRHKAGILEGNAPLLIDTNTPTIASMLKQNGYKTGVVGKWHLGLGDGNVNWNKRVSPGPQEIGFDYSFLIPATGDRVPTIYLENQKGINLSEDDPISISYKKAFDGEITGKSHPELLNYAADRQHSGTIVNGTSRVGHQIGGKSALWDDETMPQTLVDKAKNFIKSSQDKPFFLYLAYHDIHVPRLPNANFKGKTKIGPRGDAIEQMDWCTGQIVNYLEKMGIAENTLIIFSSDNGPVLNDGYEDSAKESFSLHNPRGKFRGGKYSVFEAGTRVPTIVYWPKTVKATASDVFFNHTDIYASIAKLIDHKLGDNEAPDSYEMLDAMLGKSNQSNPYLVEEGYALALKQGKWKYITPKKKNMGWIAGKGIESGLSSQPQLYNLDKDPKEEHNLASQFPEVVIEMSKKLNQIKNNNLSRK